MERVNFPCENVLRFAPLFGQRNHLIKTLFHLGDILFQANFEIKGGFMNLKNSRMIPQAPNSRQGIVDSRLSDIYQIVTSCCFS